VDRGLGFVDCHSHVVPSGDDGASSVGEGERLCREAARRGTRLLFATPHVWPHLTLTAEREAHVRAAFADLRERVEPELEVRLGWELTPAEPLLAEDLWRYELEGTGCVLMEVPFVGELELVRFVAEHGSQQGLIPVIAHPERSDEVLADPDAALELAGRGFLLQVNATSLTGYHGRAIEEVAWRLVEAGAVSLVGSDGHRTARPPYLDEAYVVARLRLGEAADALFDGSALGLAAVVTRS
jgi:protein-tyrosine phosphatase